MSRVSVLLYHYRQRNYKDKKQVYTVTDEGYVKIQKYKNKNELFDESKIELQQILEQSKKIQDILVQEKKEIERKNSEARRHQEELERQRKEQEQRKLALNRKHEEEEAAKITQNSYQKKNTGKGKGREIRIAEVREHTSKDDCWVVYKDVVYDVTKYLPSHPGGLNILLSNSGQVIDEFVKKYHDYVNVAAILYGKEVGKLVK